MRGRHPAGCRVAPFGDPRIEGRVRLPGDYRGLPRPSSPAAAKASSARPCSLDAWKKTRRPGPPAPAAGNGIKPAAASVRHFAWRNGAAHCARPLAIACPRRALGARRAGESCNRPSSQSYGILPKSGPARSTRRPDVGRVRCGGLVGAHGLGPWTSSLSETRSNQLSYAPGRAGAPPGNGTVQRGAPGLALPSPGGLLLL